MSGADPKSSRSREARSQARPQGSSGRGTSTGEPSGDPLALPFDQYQRYRLVADLLGQLRGAGPRKAPLAVLDVGGRTALLRRFLLRDKITLVDMEPSDEDGLVLGDGGRLPFQDGSFDVVTAFDTLEHVPPRHRESFVSECRRVARRWVVLAGPYEAERVVEAEETLKRFLRDKLGIEHRYLNEHREHGLPDRAAVEAQLTELGGRVTSIGHANLDRWLVLMCVTMYMLEDPALRELAGAFSRYYNASLYASDHAEPVYRHLVVAAYADAPLPDAEAFLERPIAPAGALGGFQEFAEELMTFDRERDEWRAERDRLREIARDLESDLAGHKATLSEARAEVQRLSQVKAEAEQDLEGHRRTLAELELDLDGHRERLATELAEAERLREVTRTLETDLGGHKDSLAEAREELEARARALEDMQLELERERRVGEQSRQALAQDLDEHKRVVAERDRQLEALRAEYEGVLAAAEREREEQAAVRGGLEAELAEHRAVVADVTRQLEEHREVLASRDAELERQRAELERTIAAHLETIETLQGVVVDKDGGIDHLTGEVRRLESLTGDLQGQLGAATERVRQLEAELANRWGSIKRALGPRRPPADPA